MELQSTTLLVIGGGPGGYVAAIRAGQLGIPTVLVEGASLGGTYVTQTAQTVPAPLHFPGYATVDVSAFARYGAWEADVNLDNVADARYFTPDADTYANLGALPGIGRTWRITLKRDF